MAENSVTDRLPGYFDALGSAQSILEEFWWYQAKKLVDPIQQFRPQVEIRGYYVDCVYADHIGIELDGKAYHEYERDKDRDSVILSSGHIEEIIRIPYRALCFYPNATFALLGSWHHALRSREFSLVSKWEDFVDEMKRNEVSESECIESYSDSELWSYDNYSPDGLVGNPYSFLLGHPARIARRKRGSAPGAESATP